MYIYNNAPICMRCRQNRVKLETEKKKIEKLLSDGTADEWGDVSTSESRPLAFHDALYFIIITFR